MQIKTILNRVQKFKSFVYKQVRWLGSACITGSYMVRPAMQGKSSYVTKRILLPYIRPLGETFVVSGPDGIRAFPPHQVFGL